ncbi:MAG: hypothetical protein Barrevirus19_1, partial [Barrevirus sp.]
MKLSKIRLAKSYPFTIKTFDQVLIGDLLSNPYDHNLYYIYEKSIKEDIYECKKGTKIIRFRYLLGEKTDTNYNNHDNGIIAGPMAKRDRDRTNCHKFIDGQIVFKPNCLVRDKNDWTKYYRSKEFNVGDVIITLDDAKTYRITDFTESFSTDYGSDKREDASYFDLELVKSEGGVEGENDKNHKKRLSVGSWTLSM